LDTSAAGLYSLDEGNGKKHVGFSYFYLQEHFDDIVPP